MQRCDICNGRTLQTEQGIRCMDAQCEGSKQQAAEGVICRCGESMHYVGLNSWGEPNYFCSACGAQQKL